MNPTDPDFRSSDREKLINGTICSFCPHPTHLVGVRCGVLKDNGKPCKCKAKQGWFGQLLDGLGNAIGEAKFGG